MEAADFRLLTFSLYPAVRTQRKAERVIGSMQLLLSQPVSITSCEPHRAPTPLYRVNAELPLRIVGAYSALQFILEYLRPLSELWLISVPTPDLTLTSWHLWGRTNGTKVIGLAEAYFEAYSQPPSEPGAA